MALGGDVLKARPRGKARGKHSAEPRPSEASPAAPGAAPAAEPTAPAIPGLGEPLRKERTTTEVARRIGRPRRFSLLTVRIMALNVLALGTLVAGFLFLGDYRQNLIDAKIASLRTQGYIFAGALGESAVETSAAGRQRLMIDSAQAIIRRLVEATKTRARLFDIRGELVADSRVLLAPAGFVLVEELPPPGDQGWFSRTLTSISNWIGGLFRREQRFPEYQENAVQNASDYREVVLALGGEEEKSVRQTKRGELVLTYAVPVQRYKKVVAVVLLSATDAEIERDVAALRSQLLKIFAIVLAVTMLLSFYLARTIARPVRRLAQAAERIRRGKGRFAQIPDFTSRRDEIGDLSAVLQQTTADLAERIEAIERFAADVSHEIKNPLTSLRSAVETAARVKDPERQRQLMAIIEEDVQRLDRLITDISRASRLDAELQRASPEPVDAARMLAALVEVEQATATKGEPRIELKLPLNNRALTVMAVEDRIVQVVRNIISNAKTFSPPGGLITLGVSQANGFVVITIDDQGPGIPEAKLDAIFDRFYTERPAGEKFGTHSGLGLSISKQIVEAHDGEIYAENRRGPDGRTIGARFVIRLPAA